MSKSSSSDSQTVTLAHGAFIGDKYHAPESKVTVSNDEASALRAGGYVLGEGDESAAPASGT